MADIVKLLTEFHLNVEVTDPHADHDELMHEYGFGLMENINGKYDAVIIAVPHDAYKKNDAAFLENITHTHAMIADLKGMYRNLSFSRKYWTL